MIVTDEHLNKLIPEISFFITKHINDGGDYQNFNIEDILVANQENIIKKLDYKNQHIFILYLLSCGISPNISYGNEYSILENLVMSSAYSNNNIYIIINIIENHDGQIMKLTPYVSNNHDADGVSLLMIAIDSKAFHVAKYLIDKGIDSNIRDSNGKTALDYFNMINENDVPDDFQDDYMYVKNKLEENMDQNGGEKNESKILKFISPHSVKKVSDMMKEKTVSDMMDSFGNQFQQIQHKINMVKNNIKNNIETVKNNTAIKVILDKNPELNIPLTKIKEHAQILDNIELLIDKISNSPQIMKELSESNKTPNSDKMTTQDGGKYKKGKSRRRKGKKQKTKKQTKRIKYKKGKSRKRKYKNNYRVKQNK